MRNKPLQKIGIALGSIIVLVVLGFLINNLLLGDKKTPPVTYDQEAQDKLLSTLQTRPTLSLSDLEAKALILSYLPKDASAGIVYEAPTFRMEYIKSQDSFLGEILTMDIEQAKQDAQVWLTAQGMSQQGMCDAPISFYLNGNVAEALRDTHPKFNPLLPGC